MFAPLRALLNRRLRVRREGLQLHLLLEPAPPPAPAPVAEPSRGAALRRDHQQLRALLTEHADLRHTLRHLACVEQTLARDGARGLNTMPENVLAKALAQLDGLRRDDPEFVLPDLVQRVQQALDALRERISEFESTEAMDISEASHSLFDEMERSWNGHMPAAR